ncbi:MAG: glycosyltransferase family 1 protein [Planctomycetota bacterium]|nr:glycosyltransferase family 1 protein [Planctomycetota bacterium]
MTRLLVSGLVLDQPMGGVRRHNQELLPRVARRLADEGGHLAVLAGRGGIGFDLPAPIELLTSDVPARPIPMRAMRESRALNEAARAGGYDLVHSGHLPAPRGLGVPFSLTLHDLRHLDGEHSPFSRRLIAKQVVGWAVERAARILTVSEATASQLRARWPRCADKLTLVPNAADHFAPLPRNPGREAELLHIGHVEPRKNLEVVIRALAHARDLPPLRLAGAGKGDELERLRALAAELEVDVRFHGPFEDADLPRLLATCAAFVLPSRLEGFGIPALEAQRAGAPLAISDLPALREVVGPEVPSFAPDDVAGCARALREALASEPVPAITTNTWDDAAERWLAALRSL